MKGNVASFCIRAGARLAVLLISSSTRSMSSWRIVETIVGRMNFAELVLGISMTWPPWSVRPLELGG